jgi:hypothetical protein
MPVLASSFSRECDAVLLAMATPTERVQVRHD